MPFIKPVLALCKDRTKLAKNPQIGGPDFWMPIVVDEAEDLCAVSFDFFINWNNKRLDRDFWLKCPIDTSIIPDWRGLDDEEISSLLRQHERFRRLVDFSGANGASSSAIVFDDSQDWTSENSGLAIAHWPKDENSGRGLEITRVNRTYIQNLIKKKSGGGVEIGRKGLIYGTSCLECFLSATDALWPGDADFLICQKGSMRPVALIEFKKHTERSLINFQDQRLSNYYPYPDGRKYDRLALLSEQIIPGSRVKLLTIYYSTNPSELNIKIEEIVGASGNLIGNRQVQIPVVPKDPKASYRAILASVLNF
jgi:hypothetical protein